MFFVFNTSFCKSDEDDPKDAIVYFYPREICDDQKHELCFQLVGISQFLSSAFTSPAVVSLDQGKFAFCRSQNYLLVLGGKNVMESTILKENLQFLYSVFTFCLKDINSVLMACHNNRVQFLQKMKEVWDHILLSSGFFGNMTHSASSIIPVSTFSQKNSYDIHSRTRHLLHMCQRNPPVIAGAVFCEKLLVYSQLIPEVTRSLMFLLNSQYCDTLHNVPTVNGLPPGVKMKKVYLTRKEINNILKHNHMKVGTQIRYQNYKKASMSQCGTTSLSSGSEGDVDSGNSSEAAETYKSDTSVFSYSDAYSHSKSEHPLVSTSEVLETHSSHFSSFHLSKVSDKNLQRHVSTDTERSCSTAYESSPGNVFDHYRRHSQYAGPISGSLWKRDVLQRRHSFSCVFNSKSPVMDMYCDSEFSLHTSLLRIFECTEKFDLSISRKCNFENLPSFSYRTMQNVHSLLAESCYLCLIKNHNLSAKLLQRGVEKRLQILKCRLNKRRNKNQTYSTQSSKCSMDGSFRRKKNTSAAESIQDSTLLNINERQEMFLYIQRYCGCTLFLLLNNSFDEDLLSDLWMHGFSDLGEIELESKKCMLSTNSEKKTDFQIYVFDNFQHEMSGSIPYVNASESDVLSDATSQMIHVDLQSNTALHSVSHLSQNRSLVAYRVSQNEVYYIQPGTVNVGNEVSIHREPFTHLYRKAKHRIKRYFGITVIEV